VVDGMHAMHIADFAKLVKLDVAFAYKLVITYNSSCVRAHQMLVRVSGEMALLS